MKLSTGKFIQREMMKRYKRLCLTEHSVLVIDVEVQSQKKWVRWLIRFVWLSRSITPVKNHRLDMRPCQQNQIVQKKTLHRSLTCLPRTCCYFILICGSIIHKPILPTSASDSHLSLDKACQSLHPTGLSQHTSPRFTK